MSGIDQFRYDGRRALVVGGATGMGAAAANVVRDLGATVTVMDLAPVEYETDQVIEMDLRDKGSIDHAIDQLGGPVNAVFSAAGIADGPDLMRTNFIGHRHLIERLLADDLLPRGRRFASSRRWPGWVGRTTLSGSRNS